MSAFGQKRTLALQKGVSASPPKADIRQHERHVHYGQAMPAPPWDAQSAEVSTKRKGGASYEPLVWFFSRVFSACSWAEGHLACSCEDVRYRPKADFAPLFEHFIGAIASSGCCEQS
jgi:hypothetical protein